MKLSIVIVASSVDGVLLFHFQHFRGQSLADTESELIVPLVLYSKAVGLATCDDQTPKVNII